MTKINLEQLAQQYKLWLTNNNKQGKLTPVDRILIFNTLSLLNLDVEHPYINRSQLSRDIEVSDFDDLIDAPKYLLLFYSFFNQNNEEISSFFKDWIEFLYSAGAPEDDYSFPYYYYTPTEQRIGYNPLISSFENINIINILNYEEKQEFIRSKYLTYIKSYMVLQFQQDNFITGCEVLRIINRLGIRDYCTESCINKLILGFNIKGYFGVYRKEKFSDDELTTIYRDSFDAFLTLYEYCNKTTNLEHEVFIYHNQK